MTDRRQCAQDAAAVHQKVEATKPLMDGEAKMINAVRQGQVEGNQGR